ncbi:hypothetical protein HYDPIDRAFT_146830 [Hydnomerulius pinastri MD-312]|nr:hypothetical protein HYDPIDRAFT_146830 [Hydnomerulius pinastri MD-312]
MRFPSSTPPVAALGNGSWTRHTPCNRAIIARYLSQSAVCHKKKFGRKTPHIFKVDTFETVGVTPDLAASLRAAFPNVEKPTAMQKKVLRGIIGRQDILLQDDTGSGKSFAVMLGLLSQPGVVTPDPDEQGAKKAGPTILLLVPHRDLAYQYLHWIHHLTSAEGDPPDALAKYAQVLARHTQRFGAEDVPLAMKEAITQPLFTTRLAKPPPHIMIATPRALIDVIRLDPAALPLSNLSTVVVDEVDAMLDLPNIKRLGRGPREVRSQQRKHVPVLAQVLDLIYPQKGNERIFARSVPFREELLGQGLVPARRPQLIMLSATMRTKLRAALTGAFGWVKLGSVLKLIKKGKAAVPAHSLDRTAVHHVLVVSKTGDIKNIEGARPPQIAATPIAAEGANENDEDVFFDDDDLELPDNVDKELLNGPISVDPAMLEAVATTFALEVPRIALLVLHPSATVHKIVFELRQLKVNAQPFNLVENEASRAHLLSRNIGDAEENPTLIVGTLATVRGVDFPELSHVFMLGVPEERHGDVYLHVAGRVGRFGRRGKVITVVEERKEETQGKKVVVTDDPKKMTIVLKRIGIKATKLEHFD